jgi:tRNA threonylcarbamoyladenosine biosynthesis protein TsaB
MLILGVDCASKLCSVSVMENEKILYSRVCATNATHSQNLLVMVDNRMKICEIKSVKNIDALAVTVGPGSFTGIRIGLALIKGLAAAYDTPCVGVSSLAALAESINFNGIKIPVFDARRNQIYACAIDGENILIDDFCRDVHKLDNFIKTLGKKAVFVGDGKALCYNIFGKNKNIVNMDFDVPCRAAGACKLAKRQLEKGISLHHSQLTPSYLRLSQAERELKERTKNNESFTWK